MKIRLSSLFIALVLTAGCPVDRSLRVGSYNVRCPVDSSEKAWDARKEDLVALLGSLDLDVFGLQETVQKQNIFITNALPQYAMVGDFRDADRVSGEASGVYYRKDRFTLLKSDTFWLSETPHTPGSKGWGAAFPRVCTWALLADRRSGRAILFANTHTDHISALARKKGLELILQNLAGLADKNTPVILTGDHNCRESEEPAKAVAKVMKNAILATETPPEGPWRTFNGWEWKEQEVSAVEALAATPKARNARKGSPDGGDKGWEYYGPRIDYIYVSPDVRVKSYTTRADPRPGKKVYPSDHFPVAAVVELPPNG